MGKKMPERKLFTEVRKIVRKIPKGKVTTYGRVAQLLGLKNPRIVGFALRGNKDSKIPCHRIVKAGGFLAKNYSLGGWQEQKRRLLSEGVKFIEKDRVDLNKHFWRG